MDKKQKRVEGLVNSSRKGIVNIRTLSFLTTFGINRKIMSTYTVLSSYISVMHSDSLNMDYNGLDILI